MTLFWGPELPTELDEIWTLSYKDTLPHLWAPPFPFQGLFLAEWEGVSIGKSCLTQEPGGNSSSGFKQSKGDFCHFICCQVLNS